jgi:hypothetical protein
VSTLARIAIIAALLVGCQNKSKAPTPSAGSAAGSAVPAAPPSADAAEAGGSGMAGSDMAGSDMGSAGSAGSAEGSASAVDAGTLQRGMGPSPELRQEKLHRLIDRHPQKKAGAK